MAGRLDGNAIAGRLAEIFGREMTVALNTCDGCGAVAQVAELVVYVDAPAAVVRCPGCDALLMRVGVVGGSLRLDLRGVRVLQLR